MKKTNIFGIIALFIAYFGHISYNPSSLDITLEWQSAQASSECNFIKNNDLKYYCKSECNFIKNNDLKYMCKGQYDFIRNNDLKYFV